MGRALNPVEDNGVVPGGDRRVARSTARAFAAAISALLITTLVISRTSDALEASGTASGTAIESGVISIEDDDQGRSLFDLSDMAPGRPEQRCIEVRYTGSILPVDLSLLAESTGDLAPYLNVSIDSGRGGDFESCAGFVADRSVFTGTLATLAETRRTALGRVLEADAATTFRVRFELADDSDALGRTASVDFVWEVTP